MHTLIIVRKNMMMSSKNIKIYDDYFICNFMREHYTIIVV